MKLMSTHEVSELIGVPVETLRYWRWRGEGPLSFKIGRTVRYESSDVLGWVAERKAATSAGAGAA